MFGVTYIWDGRKFHTITKDKKVRARRRFKQKLLALGCNWDLYMKDDNNEVTRMNALAWVEVMKYVQRRLKFKMYWLDSSVANNLDVDANRGASLGNKSAKSPSPDTESGEEGELDEELGEEMEEVKLVKQDLHEIEFPTERWFKGSMMDIDDWCRKLNINPEIPRDAKKTALKDITMFCTLARGETVWLDEAREIFSRDSIKGYTEFIFGHAIEDKAIAIEELTDFYIDVATGENDFFFTAEFGEEDDMEAVPEPKEREEYVTEDEFDPDIAAIEQLEQAGLPQVRDAQGRFLPGHTIRKPKDIYSPAYPKLACDTCYAAQSCPKFKPGSVCAYTKLFERFNTRDPNDIIEMLFSMVNLNGQRIQRTAIFEMLEGGAPDPMLSGLMQMQIGLLREARDLQEALTPGRSRTMTNPDMEVTIKARNPQSGGILDKLFGHTPANEEERAEEDDDFIDADVVEDDELNNLVDEQMSQPHSSGLRRKRNPRYDEELE